MNERVKKYKELLKGVCSQEDLYKDIDRPRRIGDSRKQRNEYKICHGKRLNDLDFDDGYISKSELKVWAKELSDIYNKMVVPVLEDEELTGMGKKVFSNLYNSLRLEYAFRFNLDEDLR